MTWMLTIGGREHHLAGYAMQGQSSPQISEIAHALAQINRFTGHCHRPYSVAEHSLLVADLARMDGATSIVQLAALMHDAHEAFCGDMSSPVKWVVGNAWDVFESQQAQALHTAFNLRTVMLSARADIRRWDLIALATERRDLTLYTPESHLPWPILDTPSHVVEPSSAHNLSTDARCAMRWGDWRDAFRDAWTQLTEQAWPSLQIDHHPV